jgi:hypothetical protein
MIGPRMAVPPAPDCQTTEIATPWFVRVARIKPAKG